MNVRNLLRKLIGWDELDIKYAPAVSVSQLWSHIHAQEKEIERLQNALPYQSGKISERPREKRVVPDTWEQVVAIFADNPQNFEEN